MTLKLSRRRAVGRMVAATAAIALPIRTNAQQPTIVRRQVEIEVDGGKFDAYLAAPVTGTGPGVVLKPRRKDKLRFARQSHIDAGGE